MREWVSLVQRLFDEYFSVIGKVVLMSKENPKWSSKSHKPEYFVLQIYFGDLKQITHI